MINYGRPGLRGFRLSHSLFVQIPWFSRKSRRRSPIVEAPPQGVFWCSFIHRKLKEFTLIEITQSDTVILNVSTWSRGSSHVVTTHTETTSGLPTGFIAFIETHMKTGSALFTVFSHM
ncbi:hypothetical protein XENOCAPTIV_017679 [Xenoophorus captivus]|uniref:Uncharacterized protein n=1 Tax=Xenoophorus captivus TaxID=1517983 RepID=A0ABV0R283_9TELE